MKDQGKSRTRLLAELKEARDRIDGLERTVARMAQAARREDGDTTPGSGPCSAAEYKRVVRALRESEETFRAFAEHSPDVIMRFDRSRRHLYVNRTVEQQTGLARDAFLGKTHAELGFPEDLVVIWEEALQRVFDKAEPHRVEFMLPARIWIDWLLVPEFDEHGDVRAVVTTARDITRLKKSEGRLKESERRLAEIIEFLPDATLVINGEGRVLYWNRALERMTGVEAEEMLGRGNHEYAVPFYGDRRPMLIDLVLEPRENVDDQYRRISRYNETVIGETSYVPRLKGGKAYLLATAAPLYDTDGRVVAAIETIRDITDRRKAEEALTITNKRFSELLDSLDAVVHVEDMETKEVLFINRLASELFGAVTGKTCWRVFQLGQSAPCSFCTNDRLIDETGKPTGGVVREVRNSLNGRWYECRDRAMHWFDDRLVKLSVAMDITEKKRAEEEGKKLLERLHRAEKMEVLGLMAGGVAHDLNNVLGVLVGYSELLLPGMPEGSPQRRQVQNILSAGQRGGAIVQDLLTLARRNVDRSEVVKLNAVVRDYLKTPEFEAIKRANPGVVFEVILADRLLNLRGSPHHLGKTVMNLMSNAVEAMPEGGRVVVRTANRYLDTPLNGYDQIEEGDYVVLAVSDNGKGISKADIGKSFEPFYTKKVMGRSGTGLGLSVVWGTVKDHRGYIDVQSEEGRGCVFALYFPVTREEAMEERGQVAAGEYQGRGERILVVDDVEEQRDLAQKILTRIGYRVDTVSGGEEAVEYLKTRRADLIVLDMIMGPGMDGYETYRKIHEMNPRQKAIIVSGYSESDRVKKAQALGAGAYVPKPYITEQIGLAIRRELDGSADSG
ncbi:MAG: PAS domain S-box protein [Deltaproteobacteria bacterium]|nr:PAS domain S-box protein [Deltaproteobacteria bacterium]